MCYFILVLLFIAIGCGYYYYSFPRFIGYIKNTKNIKSIKSNNTFSNVLCYSVYENTKYFGVNEKKGIAFNDAPANFVEDEEIYCKDDNKLSGKKYYAVYQRYF